MGITLIDICMSVCNCDRHANISKTNIDLLVTVIFDHVNISYSHLYIKYVSYANDYYVNDCFYLLT